jgi:type IV pilus assembly protein PilB
MQRAPVNLGVAERLLAAGLLTPVQLELAECELRRRGGSLPRLLVELNLVSAERLAEYIAKETHTQWVDLAHFKIDDELVQTIPSDVARRLRALPLSRTGDTLLVALADPSNVVAIDQLTRVTGLRIEAAAATERDILNTLDRIQLSGPSIQQSIEKIIDEEVLAKKTDSGALIEVSDPTDGDDAPIIHLVNQVIQRAVNRRASDIHFEPEEKLMRIRTRIDGVLHPDVLIPKSLQSAVAARMKILGDMDVTETRTPQDGRASINVSRRRINLRISSLPTQFGESVVVRILDTGSQVSRLSHLGLTPEFETKLRAAIESPYGVVIVTGPTGSGKTTTLYAVLNEINQPDLSIFTLEDPVEMPLAGIRQTQIREEVGLTFSSALRSLLRQDPDVILVGETRDTETATLMVRASLTGHLVFSTLHTNDAPGAIPRLIDMGVEPYLLPSSLVAIVAQRLVRRLCPNCREPLVDPEATFVKLRIKPPAGAEPTLWRAVGCDHCHGSGYRGRQAVFEIMTLDERFHAPIIRRAPHSEFVRLAHESGMVSMFDDGLRRAVQGATTLEELLRVARPYEP